MNESNKEEFKLIMVGIGELYNKEITKPLMRIYFSSLINYSLNDIEEGISHHAMDAKHGSFFPKPADIVRHLQVGNLSSEEKSELAWAQITNEVRRTGSYGNLVLDDKQALAALRSFTSWKELCMMDVDKQTWAKKEFISMYSTYEKTPLEMLPSSLPGLIGLQDHKEKQAQSMQSLLGGMEKFRAKQIN